jgi:hypothetical protein
MYVCMYVCVYVCMYVHGHFRVAQCRAMPRNQEPVLRSYKLRVTTLAL